jgi:hypothetical protein
VADVLTEHGPAVDSGETQQDDYRIEWVPVPQAMSVSDLSAKFFACGTHPVRMFLMGQHAKGQGLCSTSAEVAVSTSGKI